MQFADLLFPGPPTIPAKRADQRKLKPIISKECPTLRILLARCLVKGCRNKKTPHPGPQSAGKVAHSKYGDQATNRKDALTSSALGPEPIRQGFSWTEWICGLLEHKVFLACSQASNIFQPSQISKGLCETELLCDNGQLFCKWLGVRPILQKNPLQSDPIVGVSGVVPPRAASQTSSMSLEATKCHQSTRYHWQLL